MYANYVQRPMLDLPVKLRDFKSEHETGGHRISSTLARPCIGQRYKHQRRAGQANPLTFNRRYCTSASNGPARRTTRPRVAGAWPSRAWTRTAARLRHNRNGGAQTQHCAIASSPTGAATPMVDTFRLHHGQQPAQRSHIRLGTSGHPLYKGPAPLATSATTFGQWWIDSSYTNNTHTVATLELGPIAGAANLYRYTSAQDSVYGGFFPSIRRPTAFLSTR